MGYPEVTNHILGPIRSPDFYYYNKPFRVMSFISGIAYIIHHAGVWLIHGLMQSSITIFMNDDSASADKIEDEEDPSPLETTANNARRKRHRSLMLFHRNMNAVESEKGMDDVDNTRGTLHDAIDERSPDSSLPVPAQRSSLDGSLDKHGSHQSSVQSINEGDRGKNENNDTCKAPDTTAPSVGDEAHKINGSRRSMMLRLGSSSSILVSQKSRLLEPSEVMHLMGFDESTTDTDRKEEEDR
eukprot:scaffold20875_cov85-Skeletonema_dohrnii-CCMP3373.AAC.1